MVHICLQVGEEKPDFTPALGLQEEPLVIPKNEKQSYQECQCFRKAEQYVDDAVLFVLFGASFFLAFSLLTLDLQTHS